MQKPSDPPVNQKRFAPDWWLFLIVLLLLTFGVVMVYDASYPIAAAYDDYHHDMFYFLRKQLLSAAIGLGGFFVCSRIPYWKLRPLAVPGFIGSILLLVIVWKLGHASLGARRWIGLGPVVIQPSELAKPALVLFLAWLFAERPSILRNGLRLSFLSVAVAIPLVLTERQPDLGTAATMFFTFLVLLITAGTRPKFVGILLAVSAVAAIGTLFLPSKAHPGEHNYRMKRMMTFVHPEADKEGDGYQVWHSLVALGSGGWTGAGLGKSHEKRPGGLPAQRTDFIFAVVGEEFGFVGTSLVVLAFLLLTVRGLTIALHTRDPFGRFLATGLTSMVSVQALLNIAVVTAAAPTTGIPLPLVSYGGSALIPTLCGLGILLGISRYPYFRTKSGPLGHTPERHSDRLFKTVGIQ